MHLFARPVLKFSQVETNAQTDISTNTQYSNREADSWTDRRKDIRNDSQTYRHTESQIDVILDFYLLFVSSVCFSI